MSAVTLGEVLLCLTANYTFQTAARGEYRLGRELERFDPKNRLLFNVCIPRSDGSTSEIDMLCIDTTGIYVLESKSYSDRVFGSVNDRTWAQTFPNGDKFKFPNPIWQNEGHVKTLQQLCKRR